MFLHVSVILSTGEGGVPGQVPTRTRYPPPGPGTPHPRRDQVHIPQARYTPRDQVHPPGTSCTPRQVHPPPGAVHAGRYGQQAGGTHPTGMHSFFFFFLLFFNSMGQRKKVGWSRSDVGRNQQKGAKPLKKNLLVLVTRCSFSPKPVQAVQ